MELTAAQLQTLKVWVEANANSVYEQSTADMLNAQASPPHYIYRTFVPMTEIMANGFDWTRVDNLPVGKSRIWEWMERAYTVNGTGGLNPSKVSCREGINAVWVGTAADRLVRDVVYSYCYRAATVAEKLFSTGAGTAPVANGDGSGPATVANGSDGLPLSGPVTLENLIEAANS